MNKDVLYKQVSSRLDAVQNNTNDKDILALSTAMRTTIDYQYKKFPDNFVQHFNVLQRHRLEAMEEKVFGKTSID